MVDEERNKHPIPEAQQREIVSQVEAIVRANEIICCGPGWEKLSDEALKILLVIMLRGE